MRSRRIDLLRKRIGLERPLVFFLPLHASVLEPDLNLTLGEVEQVGDLDAPTSRQVPVEVELLLQLERLVSGVGRPRTFAVHANATRALCETYKYIHTFIRSLRLFI